MNKKRLGRGLGSLIGNINPDNGSDGWLKKDGLIEIDIDR
ncbi:MAG: hypothetical protein ACI8XW_003913, partial [Gammaproteobacteria bacterium]